MSENRAGDAGPEEEQPTAAAATNARRTPPPRRHWFFLAGVAFEIGLGGLALALSWLLGLSAATHLVADEQVPLSAPAALLGGSAAALPLLLALLVIDRHPPRALRAFRDEVEQIVTPLFRPLGLVPLAVLSLAAGWGEELLYRGLIQTGLQLAIGGLPGIVVGLSVASLAFGLSHFLSRTYALLAGLVGVYFGLLVLLSGQLLTALVAHAVYDFFALLYLTRRGSPRDRGRTAA